MSHHQSQELEQVQDFLAFHQKAAQSYQHNKQQAIFKLPKHFFIMHLLPFIDDQDVLTLSITCKSLHETIYNPFAFQFLLSSQRPQKKTLNLQSQFIKLDERRELPDIDDEDPCIVQLQNVMYINDYLAQRTKKFEEANAIYGKDKEILTKELKIAREITNKNFERIIALDKQLNVREVAKVDHGDTITELKMNYQSILQEKDKTMKRLIIETENMIQEKEDLRKEMVTIQERLEKMAGQKEIYKEALVKVNKFFSFTHSSASSSATTSTTVTTNPDIK